MAKEGELRTEDDEPCAHDRGNRPAPCGLQGKEHGRCQEDTADGGEQAHGNIWDAGFEIVFTDVLEVEVSVEAGQETEQGDEEFRKRGVHIHEELALDVLGSKATEAGGWVAC